MTDTAKTFTRATVSAAANQAADDVLAAIDAGDEGVRDVVNLLVNLTMARLDDPTVTLADAIEANYGADPDDGPVVERVLDWCRQAV